MSCKNCLCQNCVSNNAKEQIKAFFNEMRFELSDEDRKFLYAFIDTLEECQISYSQVVNVLHTDILNINDFIKKVVNIDNFDFVQVIYSISHENDNHLRYFNVFSEKNTMYETYQEDIIDDILACLETADILFLKKDESDIAILKNTLNNYQILIDAYIKNNVNDKKILDIFKIYQLLVNSVL